VSINHQLGVTFSLLILGRRSPKGDLVLQQSWKPRNQPGTRIRC